MPEETAERLAEHGIVAVAGLSEGILCAGALTAPPPDAARLRSIAATLSGPKPSAESSGVVSGWVAEHEAKEMLVGRGLAVPRGRVVRDADDAMRVAGELGGPVALKASSPVIQHKSDISALVLGVAGEAVREAYGRVEGLGGVVLVEEMMPPGVEVLIAVRRDGVVPVLVVALGGVWVEIFDDVVLIPLPADADRVERAVRRLKAAPLLVGGRGRPAGDIRALAEVAAAVGAMALEEGLDLVELNPVFVRPDGVTVVDAVIRRGT
jgi:acetyl-CoA synthetase